MIGSLKIPLTIEAFTGDPALHTPSASGVVSQRTDVSPNRFYYALAGSSGAGVDLGEFGYAFIDTTDNTLAIRVSPGGYDAAPELVGEEGVATGVTAPFVNAPQSLWGFTLTCGAGFWALPWLLQAVQGAALQDTSGTGGVTVRDSLNVRPLDLAQGYTERAMYIYDIKPQGGAVRIDDELWLPGGFMAQFRALNPEAVPGWSTTPLWGGRVDRDDVISGIASTSISALRITTLESGSAVYADPTDLDHASAALGFVTTAASGGASVTGYIYGSFSDPSWSWNVSAPIWLGANGTLTQTQPASPSVFSRVVAVATSSTSIFFEPQPPILL